MGEQSVVTSKFNELGKIEQRLLKEAIEEGITVHEKRFDDAATRGDMFVMLARVLGYRVARKGWNGKDIFIELQVPHEYSKMTQPYIYIDTLGLKTNNPNAPKGRVPWLASQTDMLSDDWEVVEG